MRVLIYGAGKTGTTAVYYAFMNAAPGMAGVFEPPELSRLDYASHRDMLVKSLAVLSHARESESFRYFDKKILIVRHPFDRLISFILYAPNNGQGFSDDRNMETYLNLLRRKLADPASVSMREIADLVQQYRPVEGGVHAPAKVLETIAETYPDFHLLRYEDFVDGKLDALSAYCGLKISGNPKISGTNHQKVIRSKSYGDWHKWFLPEDVEYFRAIYGTYLDRFGYDAVLQDAEPLDEASTIGYAIKVTNQGRRQRWLPDYVPGEINMTTEGQRCQAGRKALARGDVDRAEELVNRVLAKDPKIAGVYDLSARVLSARGDFEAAAAELRKAIDLLPDEPEFQKRLALILRQAGRKAGTRASGGPPADTAVPQPQAEGPQGRARRAPTPVVANKDHYHALVLGQSHLRALYEAATGMQQAGRFPAGLSAGFIQLRHERFQPLFPAPGALNETIVQEVSEHQKEADFVVSAIGGNAHSTLGLLDHSRPFDFVLESDPSIPLLEGREVLPYGLVRKALRKRMEPSLQLLAAIRELVDKPFLHLESPPPIPSTDHIRAHPGLFTERLERFEVAPASLRLKLWKLQSQMFRGFCKKNGIVFLPVPPAVVDQDGMLARQAWPGDPTHANAWFGEQVFEQLAQYVASQTAARAGAA